MIIPPDLLPEVAYQAAIAMNGVDFVPTASSSLVANLNLSSQMRLYDPGLVYVLDIFPPAAPTSGNSIFKLLDARLPVDGSIVVVFVQRTKSQALPSTLPQEWRLPVRTSVRCTSLSAVSARCVVPRMDAGLYDLELSVDGTPTPLSGPSGAHRFVMFPVPVLSAETVPSSMPSAGGAVGSDSRR